MLLGLPFSLSHFSARGSHPLSLLSGLLHIGVKHGHQPTLEFDLLQLLLPEMV